MVNVRLCDAATLVFFSGDWDILRLWIARPRSGLQNGFAKIDTERLSITQKKETAKPKKLDKKFYRRPFITLLFRYCLLAGRANGAIDVTKTYTIFKDLIEDACVMRMPKVTK